VVANALQVMGALRALLVVLNGSRQCYRDPGAQSACRLLRSPYDVYHVKMYSIVEMALQQVGKGQGRRGGWVALALTGGCRAVALQGCCRQRCLAGWEWF